MIVRSLEIVLVVSGAALGGITVIVWLHHLSVVGQLDPALRIEGDMAPLRLLLDGLIFGGSVTGAGCVLRALRRRGVFGRT